MSIRQMLEPADTGRNVRLAAIGCARSALALALAGNVACSAAVATDREAAAQAGASAIGPGPSAGGQGGVTPSGEQPIPLPVDAAGQPLEPGRVTLRRLSAVEYCNSAAALFYTSTASCTVMPGDAAIYGFDNIPAAQSTSPLHVERFESAAQALVQELLASAPNSAGRAAIMICEPDTAAPAACALQITANFAKRAWRRPVAEAEIASYASLVELALAQGDTIEYGIGLALQRVLLSPHFLFRVELDPELTSSAPHPLSPWELATRLSYSLWSSLPDDALFAAAEAGTLTNTEALVAEAKRMLQDVKANALASNFVGQWLHLRDLPEHDVDPLVFPSVDPALRSAMRTETELVFQEFTRQPLPLSQLLTADFTYVNARLAEHYGMPPVADAEAFERVSLVGNATRKGLLTHAGLLTVTSHPDRTSAVARGAWVLKELMCSPPPPPPANVAELPEAGPMGAEVTMRQRLEQHRSVPACASCHTLMDPIGLGLENYDGIGLHRDVDESGREIDSAGQLPDGSTFSGPLELAQVLSADPRFQTCVAEKLMTYAIGRPFEGAAGAGWVRHVVADAQTRGGSFGALVESVVSSAAFTMRHAALDAAP